MVAENARVYPESDGKYHDSKKILPAISSKFPFFNSYNTSINIFMKLRGYRNVTNM